MGDNKPGAPSATPKPNKRRPVSLKRLYWALNEYIDAVGLDPKDDSIDKLLDLLKDDVMEETR